MADVTPPILRGLLVPDPRITWRSFSNALSSVSQAGPLPGVPTPESTNIGGMVLESSGTQSADKQLRVRTVRGGHPGSDEAAFVWENDGDALWRAWNAPHMIADFEVIDLNAGAGYWQYPHALRLQDGTIAVAAVRENRYVDCWVRSTAGLWTSVEVYDRGSAYSSGSAYPCLVQLPKGTLLLFHWVLHGDYAQIRQQISTDGGTTWSTGQRAVLPTVGLPTTVYVQKRIRAAYLNGQIALFVWLTTVSSPIDQIHQYASVDLGNTFSSLDALTDGPRGYPDVVAFNGRLVLAYVARRASATPNHIPYYRVMSSAYEKISSLDANVIDAAGTVEWGTDSGSGNYPFTAGELAITADDDGTLYLYGREHDAGSGGRREVYVVRSTDGGDSWESQGQDGSAPGTGATVWNGQDAAYYPLSLAVAPCQGRILMVSAFNGGPAGDSLLGWYLGGFSTVSLPLSTAGYTPSGRHQIGWQRTWVPITSPHAYGLFTQATTGIITETLTASGYQVKHASGASRVAWAATPTTSLSEGLIVLFHLKLVVGEGYLRARISDGATTCYDVRVKLTATSIVLEDWGSGSAVTITSVSTTAATYGAQVLLALAQSGGSGQV